MKPSTYLNWFRRLLILGAVIAGATASAAGAVTRPPDVQDAAAALHSTPEGLKADGLRLQGIAQVYQQLQLTPDALDRYAANNLYGVGQSSVTDSFARRPPDVRDTAAAVSQPSPVDRIIAQEQGRHADPRLFSNGQSSTSYSTLVSRPPDISDAAQAVRTGSLSQSRGFDWGDWAIGIGTGLGVALLLGVGLMVGRQQRQRVQPA